MRAERAAEGRIDGDLFADVGGADQIETEAAVLGRDFQPQQIERRGLAHQLPRQFPVVAIETISDREHLPLHELGGRLSEHPLFFGKLLADEHVVRADIRGQEAATAGNRQCVGHVKACYGGFMSEFQPRFKRLQTTPGPHGAYCAVGWSEPGSGSPV